MPVVPKKFFSGHGNEMGCVSALLWRFDVARATEDHQSVPGQPALQAGQQFGGWLGSVVTQLCHTSAIVVGDRRRFTRFWFPRHRDDEGKFIPPRPHRY